PRSMRGKSVPATGLRCHLVSRNWTSAWNISALHRTTVGPSTGALPALPVSFFLIFIIRKNAFQEPIENMRKLYKNMVVYNSPECQVFVEQTFQNSGRIDVCKQTTPIMLQSPPLIRRRLLH